MILTKTELHAAAIARIRECLAAIPWSEEDKSTVKRLSDALPEDGSLSVFQVAHVHQIALTSAIWIAFLLGLTEDWSAQAQDTAVLVPDLRQLYPSQGEPSLERLIDRVADALCALGWAGLEQEEGQEEGEEEGSPAALLKAFYELARVLEDRDDVDKAYDMDGLALELGPDSGDDRETVARHALNLAINAGRTHQIAVCSASLGETIAIAADTLPKRRLEAFTACEIAIERLAAAPKFFQGLAAELIVRAVAPRDYLRKLEIPALWYLPENQRPPDLPVAGLGFDRWPERVSAIARDDWLKGMEGLWTAQAWDMELDKARQVLEPPLAVTSFQADWVAWTIDHPAYRHAVPHNRSFLRERDFSRHLLALSHEITHVLSLLGAVGMALVALRIATMDAELTMWSSVPGISKESLPARIRDEGVAPLMPGEASSLFRAEQGLELSIKAQILQDVWTPWLEGLAVFGEVACDPALDPIVIGPVFECLRNFIDFRPPEGEPGHRADIDKVRAAYDEFAAMFDKRCSAAIAERGPIRLEQYLPMKDEPYFPGYVAVRGVVAAWRATTGRPLTSTEAFNLLLHATRYGTFAALPALSVGRESFERDALQRMQDWVRNLASLPRDNLEEFLRPPEKSGRGRSFHWVAGRVIETLDPAKMAEEQSAVARRLLREALASLSDPADANRIEGAGYECRWLLERCGAMLREHAHGPAPEGRLETYVRRHGQLMTLGGLLPVGRTAARFYLNTDTGAPSGYIGTVLRTTEAHVDTGEPSTNGLWFPVDHASAQLIADHYQRSGNPRIQVTRVIDLSGIAAQEYPIPYMHFLAFSYGGWFELQGPTEAMNHLLGLNAAYRSNLTLLVRYRLEPDEIARAELDVMARGRRGAERTRNWIDQSTVWRIGDADVSVDPWVSRVRALAVNVDDTAVRRSRQTVAARHLIDALFKDDTFTADIVDRGFEVLTEQTPEHRLDLATALFNSAQRPGDDDFLREHVADLDAAGLRLFAVSNLGWDVRSATLDTIGETPCNSSPS